MKLHFALGLFAAFACSGLQAQTAIMKANIPFDFHLGKTVMPAGQYDLSYSAHLLTIRERSGGRGSHAAMSLMVPASRPQPPSTGLLEVTRYGDTYLFERRRSHYPRDGGRVLNTAREEELSRRV